MLSLFSLVVLMLSSCVSVEGATLQQWIMSDTTCSKTIDEIYNPGGPRQLVQDGQCYNFTQPGLPNFRLSSRLVCTTTNGVTRFNYLQWGSPGCVDVPPITGYFNYSGISGQCTQVNSDSSILVQCDSTTPSSASTTRLSFILLFTCVVLALSMIN